jgi:RsiW-degrading membrane proteinase PrsW (M82 family)
VGSEYLGPIPDPKVAPSSHEPPASSPRGQDDVGQENSGNQPVPGAVEIAQPVEPAYREHVSGMLPPVANAGQAAAQPPRASYPAPPYPYQPPQPIQTPQATAPHPGWRSSVPPLPPGGAPQQPQGPVQYYPPGQPLQGSRPPSPSIPPYYYPGYPPMSLPYGQGQNGYIQQGVIPYGQGQNGYAQQGPLPNGYAPQAYAGYPAYPYYYPPGPYRPKRDGYQLTATILALIGSILSVIGGAVFAVLLLILMVAPTTSARISSQQLFSSFALYTALVVAGWVGGGAGLYHSIRALLRRPSLALRLPSGWIFFGLYIALLAFGFATSTVSQIYSNWSLSVLIVLLAGIFPGFCFLALAARRVRLPDPQNPNVKIWPTTWRRFTLAITSGATAAIAMSGIFEWILSLLASNTFHVSSNMIDNPDVQIPSDPASIAFMLVLLSVIAPVVEELAKPIAVAIYGGRLKSAAEAFTLGFACGVGFDLVETAGYIGMQGSQQWVDVAIQRSTAGLLHGFGSGMVGLFWYYLINNQTFHRRIRIALACLGYALLQHGVWNGSFVVALLPAPIGPFLGEGTIPLGSYQLPAIMLVYAVEATLMFAFFLYVTRRLSQGKPPFPTREERPSMPRMPEVASAS